MGIKNAIEAWSIQPRPEAERVAVEDDKILKPVDKQQNFPVSTDDYKEVLAGMDSPKSFDDTRTVPVSVNDGPYQETTVNWHDADTLYTPELDGVNGKGKRSSLFNAVEANFASGQAARAVAIQATDHVDVDNKASGGYGRGQNTAHTVNGADVGEEIMHLGLGNPMDFGDSDKTMEAARIAGNLREALGLPRTNNPDLAGAEEAVDQYKADNKFVMPEHVYTHLNTPQYRHKGVATDAWDRGVDNLQATGGAVAEWVGQQTGSASLEQYGEKIRHENTLQSNFNDRKVNDVSEIFAPENDHKLSTAADYVVESVMENLPAAIPDLAMTATGAGAGAVIARRSALAGVEGAVKKQILKSTAVAQMTSGTIQGIGSEQIRMKEAGVDDTGLAPLTSGVATGALNVVSDRLAMNHFIDASGIDEGVKRSVMQVAKDSVAAGAKAVAVGSGVGATQNAIEQTVHISAVGGDVSEDFHGMEMIDAAVRSAIGQSSLGVAAKASGATVRRVMKEYKAGIQDAGLMAAEKDLVDQSIRDAQEGKKSSLLDTPTIENANRTTTPAEFGLDNSVEVPLEVGDKVQLKTPERAVFGTGTMHQIGADEVPNLPTFRYNQINKLVTDAQGNLRPLKDVSGLVDQGSFTQQEVISYLADDHNRKIDTVYSQADAGLMNKELQKRVAKIQEQRTAQYQERMQKGESTADMETKPQRSAEIALENARNGVFSNADGSYDMHPNGKFKKTPFANDASRMKAENRVLSNYLRAFDVSTDDLRVPTSQLDFPATYHDAFTTKKAEKLGPEKVEQDAGATPETQAKTDDQSVELNMDDPDSVKAHLEIRGKEALSEMMTATDLESNTQNLFNRFVTRAKDDAAANPDAPDVIRGLNAYQVKEQERIAKLPPEQQATAKEAMVGNIEQAMKNYLKESYQRQHRLIDLGLDKPQGTELETVQHDKDTGEERNVGDVQEAVTAQEAGVSHSGAMTKDEVGASYTRRTAYAKKVIDQLSDMTGVDLKDVYSTYAKALNADETKHDSLVEGEAKSASVVLARRNNADEQQKAGQAARNTEVKHINLNTIKVIKDMMAKGDVSGLTERLVKNKLLPDFVSPAGETADTRPLYMKATMSRLDERKKGRAGIPVKLVDAEGNETAVKLDATKLTDHGLKELGFKNKHGDIELNGEKLPDIIARSFASGLAESLNHKEDFSVNLDSNLIHNDTIVWSSPDSPDTHVTYGDVKGHLRKVWRKDDSGSVLESHDINRLKYERSRLRAEFAKTRNEETAKQGRAINERIAELEGEREASIAGMKKKEDEFGETNFVDPDDLASPEYATKNREDDLDHTDQFAFDTRHKMPEKITDTRTPYRERLLVRDRATIKKAVEEANSKPADAANETDLPHGTDTNPVADVQKAEAELINEAPVEAKKGMEQALRGEEVTPEQRQKNIDILKQRQNTILGEMRHNGVAKVFSQVGKVIWKTLGHRMETISPLLNESRARFEVNNRVRQERFIQTVHGVFEKPEVTQKAYDEWLSGKNGLLKRRLERAMQPILDEVRKVDPTFEMKGAPTVFDMVEVQKRMPVLMEVLRDAGVKNIEKVVKSLEAAQGTTQFTVFDKGEGAKTIMGVRRDIDQLHNAVDKLRQNGFLKTDAPEIMAGFVRSAARYTEWGREFGAMRKRSNGSDFFDSSFKYNVILRSLSESDRTEMRSLMSAVTGSIAHNIPNWVRGVNSANFAVTSLRYLLFSGVASIPEMAAIGLRSRRGLKGSARVVTKDLLRVALTDRKGLHEMAESMGIVGQEIARHALMELHHANELTVGKAASRVSQVMFRINQQERITNVTRKLAMVEGLRFIGEHSRKALAGDKKSASYLKELQISAEDAKNGAFDRNANYQDAVHRFVHQSLANPEAGAMPLWMSDPRFAVFSSLKKFIYGLTDRVHGSIYREVKAGNITDAAASTIGYMVTASALAAVSETIRALIKNPTMQPTQNDEWDDRMWKVFSATGMQAHWQLAAAPKAAYDHDGNMALAALNPNLNWIWSDLLDTQKKTATKVAEALPITNQIPWAKEFLVSHLGGQPDN